ASASERERLIIRCEWAYMNSSPSFLAVAESLATRYPAELEGQLELGRALVNLGRFIEGVAPLERVVEMDAASLSERTVSCSACEALQWMISAYMHADSVGAADRVARRWVAQQRQSPIAWTVLGGALESEGRLREASDAFATAKRLDPKNPE